MGKIALEDLQPGMVLARDVKDFSGRVILSTGMEITGKHLGIFRAWGITEADVAGVEQEDLATAVTARIDPELRRRAEAEADTLFRHCPRNNPVMDRLYHLFVLRKVRQLSREESHAG